MKKIPKDLELLEEIYQRYYREFASFSKEEPTRSAKVYVPLDIKALAERFDTDPDIIFGRLYYHLDQKYGFKQPDGHRVFFFTPRAGNDSDAIQFPLLASVLAGLQEERSKHLLAIWIAIGALTVSVISVVVSITL